MLVDQFRNHCGGCLIAAAMLASGCAAPPRDEGRLVKRQGVPQFRFAAQRVSKIKSDQRPPVKRITADTDTQFLIEQWESQRAGSREPRTTPAASNSDASRRSEPRNASLPPDAFMALTETEMLSLALANSPVLRPLGIRVLDQPTAVTTIYDAAIKASDPFFGPQAALAEFDGRYSASLTAQNNDRVFNNATLGGDIQELVQDSVAFNSGWQRRTYSGALIDFGSIHAYDSNNRVGNTFPSYWESQWQAGVRQPLMRGAGREFNLIAGPNAQPGFNFSNGVVIARLNDQVTDADFEIQVRNFVRDLYDAYWDLDQRYRTYESTRRALDVAYKTWQTALARKESSVTGGEAHREAQARAKYHSYQREIVNTLGGPGGLYVAERRLRNMMGMPIVDSTLMRPTDNATDVRFVFDYDQLNARAMVDRTELRRQRLRLHQQRLRLTAAKNFLLPQVDLIGRYRLRGLGDDLFGDGPRFSSAQQDFWSFDHQEWEFGMEMGMIAGRRQARAAIRNASLQVNRDLAILAEQQRAVEHEVSDAHADVASSYAALAASNSRVEAARQRLDASQTLFEADKIQMEFLLDAQEDLLQAENQQSIDQARYSIALVRISATVGSLLHDVGVHIEHGCNESRVYFLPDAANEPAESVGTNLQPTTHTGQRP